ncbi:MAG: hypothetical protein EA359_13555 [Balneolaceae bacterium]|nr:MAG: hypothetical protein EA359_13555 [Balneolaceae bacterium]
MEQKPDTFRSYAVRAALIILTFLVTSCGTDSNDSEEIDGFRDGILNEIRDLLSDDMINSIENELGMPIHRGANPPDFFAFYEEEIAVGGLTVEKAPQLLHRSTVASDQERNEPGTPWADRTFRFSNQDLENYTVRFETRATQTDNEPVISERAFIIGQENRFTIFAYVENERDEGVVKSIRMFSGILTDDGISEPYNSTFMIDNSGIRGIIPSGTGRSFVDGKGISLLAEWPAGKTADKDFKSHPYGCDESCDQQ